MYSLSKIALIQLKYGSYNSTKELSFLGGGWVLLRSYPLPILNLVENNQYLCAIWMLTMDFDECTKIQYGVLFKYSQSFLNSHHPPTPALMKSFNFNIWLSPKRYIFSNPKVGYIRHCSEIEEASKDFYPPLMNLTSSPMIIPKWSI